MTASAYGIAIVLGQKAKGVRFTGNGAQPLTDALLPMPATGVTRELHREAPMTEDARLRPAADLAFSEVVGRAQ